MKPALSTAHSSASGSKACKLSEHLDTPLPSSARGRTHVHLMAKAALGHRAHCKNIHTSYKKLGLLFLLSETAYWQHTWFVHETKEQHPHHLLHAPRLSKGPTSHRGCVNPAQQLHTLCCKAGSCTALRLAPPADGWAAHWQRTPLLSA